jgi:plastocyanin
MSRSSSAAAVAAACALLAAALGLLAVLAAAPALAVDVLLTDEGVQPDVVQAAPGEQVVFRNQTDDVVRLVDDRGLWDSGDLEPGQSFAITFDEPGTVTFTSVDGGLTGTVQVGDAAASPPPAPTTSATATATPTPTPTPTATATPTPVPSAGGSQAGQPPDELAATGLPLAAAAALAALALAAGTALLRRA